MVALNIFTRIFVLIFVIYTNNNNFACSYELNASKREVLISMSRTIADALEVEITNYVNTGIESETLKSIRDSLPYSRDISRVEVERMSSSDQAFVCTLCRSAASLFLKYINDREKARELIVDLCVYLKIHSEEVCAGLFDIHLASVEVIASREGITTESICGIILQGSNCVIEDPIFDWTVNVDDAAEEITSSKTVPSLSEESEKIRILHLTDIHYEPMYKEGALADCSDPMCCINDENNWNGTAEGAGRWTDYRSCDVPWELFTDSMAQITRDHKTFDYIYFTGDIIAHAVWKTTREANKEALKQVYEELKRNFGDIPIYPLIGNHEPHPLDLFSPSYIEDDNISTQWLYDLLAEEWSRWLPSSTKETIRKDGYYTFTPRPGFRIIALNNNHCYTFNFWIIYDPQYLAEQLQWLHDTLLEAEKSNEMVHILAHIPSAEGSCYVTWAREYRRIIERFHRIIGGIFNGHTHFDEFNIFYGRDDPKYALTVGWNGGSLTPFSNVNPNYRIYDVETETYQVVNHETWIFNLTEANLNPEESPVWYKEYDFKTAFDVKDFSPASMDELLKRFAKDHDLLHKYWEYKMKMGDPSLEKGCDTECLLRHLCEATKTQFNDVRKCEDLKHQFIHHN